MDSIISELIFEHLFLTDREFKRPIFIESLSGSGSSQLLERFLSHCQAVSLSLKLLMRIPWGQFSAFSISTISFLKNSVEKFIWWFLFWDISDMQQFYTDSGTVLFDIVDGCFWLSHAMYTCLLGRLGLRGEIALKFEFAAPSPTAMIGAGFTVLCFVGAALRSAASFVEWKVFRFFDFWEESDNMLDWEGLRDRKSNLLHFRTSAKVRWDAMAAVGAELEDSTLERNFITCWVTWLNIPKFIP